jgi:septum formation protein
MKIILGSSSPRRKDILSGMVQGFEIISPEIIETTHPGEDPVSYAERISAEKARAILKGLSGREDDFLLITCDTIVTIDGKIIGKPESLKDAFDKLKTLNGRTHLVISAITIARGISRSELKTCSETTSVTFKKLSDDSLKKYLDTIEYSDKAGAYAVQENGDAIIERIDGSISNVIGFPTRLFFNMLSDMKVLDEIY